MVLVEVRSPPRTMALGGGGCRTATEGGGGQCFLFNLWLALWWFLLQNIDKLF